MKLKASRHRLKNQDVALRKPERNPSWGTLKQVMTLYPAIYNYLVRVSIL